jgi:membrane protease YdiL (CAAX protease family)
MPGKTDHRVPSLVEAFLFLAGMVVFASFIHGEGLVFWIALAGLLVMGALIIVAILRSGSAAAVFGLDRYERWLPAYMLAGLVTGLAATAAYRIWAGWPLLPGTLTFIALVSPLIGMTEELVFRGYLQGRTRRYDSLAAILVAAAAHTFYKYLVLKSLGPDPGVDFIRLVIFTFVFGLIAGILREYGRNVLPAVLAHAVFDIMVYGDFTEMPVWVWG